MISSVGIPTPVDFFLRHSVAMAPVRLRLRARALSVFSPFAGPECSILVSAIAIAATQFSRRLFFRVMVVMIRRTGFFDPCRQKLQIKKIGSLHGSAHHVLLLEAQTEANAKLSLVSTTSRN